MLSPFLEALQFRPCLSCAAHQQACTCLLSPLTALLPYASAAHSRAACSLSSRLNLSPPGYWCRGWVASEEIDYQTVATEPLIVMPFGLQLSSQDAADALLHLCSDAGDDALLEVFLDDTCFWCSYEMPVNATTQHVTAGCRAMLQKMSRSLLELQCSSLASIGMHDTCESDINVRMRCGRTCVEQMLRGGAFRSPSH